MNKVTIGEIWDDKFSSIIRDLVAKSSMFKTKIYKSILMNETVPSITVKEYINYISSFVDLWNTFSEELSEKIKSTKAVAPSDTHNKRVVNIENIKNYIYSSYDYASILQLADGILEGISKNKFTEADDVKDFKDTVAEKALNTSGSEVADVLDDALNNYTFYDDLVAYDTSAVTRFNSLSRTKIFNSKDAKDLFKAIDKTIQFLAGNNMDKYVKRLNMKLYISALNGILDYITLSLTVFATRAFVIDKYARSFYMYTKKAVEVNAIHESADDKFNQVVKNWRSLSQGWIKDLKDDIISKNPEKRESNIQAVYDLCDRYEKGICEEFPDKDKQEIFRNEVQKVRDSIDKYAKSFKESVDEETIEDTPKVDKPDVDKSGSAEEFNNVETRIIIDADDTTCRDIFKIDEFFDTFYEFLQNIGAMHDETVNLKFRDYCCYYNPSKSNEDNLFGKKLISNPVVEIISKDTLGYVEGSNAYAKINEVNQMLKEITYNPHQGIEGSFSPKNEIMHVIRGTEPEKQTIEGYQRLALDLYKYSIMLLRPFNTIYRNISDWKSKERVEGDYSLATTNLMSECAKIVSEIYRDLSMTILQKARDIETQINRLKNVEIDKTFSNLKLDVFKPKSEDITDAHMTSMVPNTTPMSIDLMDLYSLPAFESYQMYDEYLRTLPEFVNDTYLSEDLDMSAIMNNILAAISGLLNNFTKFFQNPNVQRAFTYVKNNKSFLLSLTFDGQNGLEVLPYLDNIDLSYISTFSNALNNFSPDKDLANDEAIKKFTISLYPSEEIYNLFNGDNSDKKNAKTAFKNKVLFGKTSDIQNKSLKTNREIKEALAMWIQTLEQGPGLLELVKKWSTEMNQTIKNFKNKVSNTASSTTTSNTTTDNNKGENPPSMNTGNTEQQGTQNQEQTQTNNTQTSTQDNSTNNNDNTKAQSMSKLVAEVQKAQMNVITPLQGIIFQVIKDEYRYIQEAYQIGKKPTSAPQNNSQ